MFSSNTDTYEYVDNQAEKTLNPITTSQAILAIKYKDGIMMACSLDIYYGNTLKFKNVPSIFGLHEANTLIGFTGEYSDTQYIVEKLRSIELANFVGNNVKNRKETVQIVGYLSNLLYSRRTKFNPLWNEVVVAGRDENQNWYLSYTDLYGTSFTDDIIATGIGGYFALPLLRAKASVTMDEQSAKDLLIECMTIVYSRACRFSSNVQIAFINSNGISVNESVKVKPKWHSIDNVNNTEVSERTSAFW